jgi:eukaryotic-like serine/threonine-protein kinase
MADVRDQLQSALGSAFTIERELVGGGMSRVFVATENSLGRRVAIKVLSPELANAISAERFRREIQVVAQLQHPHIVPVHTAGDANGLLYYTMPFVEGETLRARLQRDGKMPVAETLALVIELADALAYAHSRGVIHRDIKPENVLLSGSHATLADFGVARALTAATGDGRLTTVGLVLGTPAYMAPEQIAGDGGVDVRSDIYSLGLAAYEMLAGTTPFDAKSPQALLAAHVTVAPRPLGEQRPDVPPALVAVVMKCLEKEPANRPHSAAELAAELRSISSGAHPARIATTPRSRSTLVVAAGVVVGLALLAAYAVKHRAAGGSGSGTIASIAVTPLVTAAGDSADEYLADGITDDLTSALGKTGLKVASRSSAFRFKGRNIEEQRIGESLHVAAVLGGSVLRDGNTLRLKVHLTSTADGIQLWSDHFDRADTGFFAMQDDLTAAVMSKLNVTLKGGGVASHGTQNLAAYDLYLRGRFYWNKRSQVALDSAIKEFNKAVALDSTYALAYAGLADAWALIGTFGYGVPAEEFPKGRAAAEHALRLDSTLAEAHASLGIIATFYEWDWARAEGEFGRAEALNPNYSTTYLFHGWEQSFTGHPEQALASVQHARALEPLNLTINARVATMFSFLGKYDDAERELLATLALDSTFYVTRADLAWVYAMKRDFVKAARYVPDVARDASRVEGTTAAYYFARSGRTGDLRKVLAKLNSLRATQYVPADGIIAAHALLGEIDAAYAELDRAIEAKDWSALMIGLYPEFAALRSDPRYARVRRETHLEGVPSAPVPP